MKLFACMCNQPQRLSDALAPVRATLYAQPPVARWGLAYNHAGDVLLVRTPKASTVAVDLAGPLHAVASHAPAEIASDCVIGQSVTNDPTNETPLGGTDNTPPYRFRRWMFGMTGAVATTDVAPQLLERIPEYLRRNIRGRTTGELIFHMFLSQLHADGGNLDDPNLPVTTTQRALATTLHAVTAELAHRAAPQLGNLALTNGRSMIVAHLAEPLRMRRLWVPDDRGERDPAFRGVIMVSGGDGDARDGFEDVPANHVVMVSRDLKVSFQPLE